MSNVRDLFSGSTSNLGFSLRHEVPTDCFVIDGNTRKITPPTGFDNFGVESDEKTKRVYFECPQNVGNDIDLATMNLYVNYQNANGEKDKYIVDDVVSDGENVRFSWELSRKCTRYKGTVTFIVCALKTNASGEIINEWNTTLCTGAVLEGLEVDNPEVEQSEIDLIDQLVTLAKNSAAEVEAAAAKALEDVESAKTEAIAEVLDAHETKKIEYSTMYSNAIKGTASGSEIIVNDVSPLDHIARAYVHGKNLLPQLAPGTTQSNNGGTFIVQTDGGIEASGTPSNYVYMDIYKGAALARSGQITFSLAGTYTNVAADFSLLDADNKTLYQLNIYPSKPTGTLTLNQYPDAVAWALSIKRAANNTEMSGTVYPQIEFGNTATEYAPYIDPTTVTLTRYGKDSTDNPYSYIPDAYGNVDIPSLSPTMTLTTDLGGVTIELEYNRDISAATKEELATAIGDIETSLENIITKYGLGGDSE